MYEHHKYKNKNYKTIRRKKKLEEMGGLSCPQIGQWILRSDAKNTSNKREINWNLCKKKNLLCMKKNIIKRVKRKSTEWKGILNHIFDKNFYSEIYKELLQFNNKKTKEPV